MYSERVYMVIYLHRLGVFLLSQCQMMRARTEFSLKNADDIFNPKIETKRQKENTQRREKERERNR